MMKHDRAIVLAADVDTLAELTDLVQLTVDVPDIVAVKIGCLAGLKFGLKSVVTRIQRCNSKLKIIYDHQKAGTDIPAISERLVELCDDSGIDEFIIFPQAGPITLRATIESCNRLHIKPIVGLTMTHAGYLSSDGGWIEEDALSKILTVAREMGVTDYVLPGNKPVVLKHYATVISNLDLTGTIYMPGIGSQGGDILQACMHAMPHAARPIIGSAIYGSEDPGVEMRKFAGNLWGPNVRESEGNIPNQEEG